MNHKSMGQPQHDGNYDDGVTAVWNNHIAMMGDHDRKEALEYS
jgi:hypothetical protein